VSNPTPQDIARDVLAKIPGSHKKSGNGYSFKCPAHEDRQASAAIYIKQDSVAFKCFAGCSTDEFCAAIGITKADLQARRLSSAVGVQIVYPYTDAKGNLLCEHLRMKPGARSRFYWRRYDQHGRKVWTLNAGWFEPQGEHLKRIDTSRHDPTKPPQAGAVWLDAAPRVLYRLPKLKAAIQGTLTIWNEGEKDVETAEAWGFLSTTAGGAKDWRDEYADDLAGLDLVIIADNDAPGRVHAETVARACHGKAARVRVIDCLPGVKAKGDLSDWKAMGHTRDELLALIAATPDYVPAADAVEDESTAVEVEPDDAPISGDPKIEKYLRQIARNAARVNDAVDLILRKLGFAGDHNRLLVKLGSIAPHLLGTISCCHEWLAAKYGMSVSTVARDIQKLLDEQKQIGVELVSYTPGTYNPQSGMGYASKFRRNYLRWALEAISIAIETRGDLEYSHDALNRACGEVAKKVPRLPIEEIDKAEPEADNMAESRPDGRPNLTVLKAKHRRKATAVLERLLKSMTDDGLRMEEAELILSDAFNDATDVARECLEKSRPADHIETVRQQPVLTIHDGQQNGFEGAGPSLAYGLQNDDHRLPGDDPVSDTEIHDLNAFPLSTKDARRQDKTTVETPVWTGRAWWRDAHNDHPVTVLGWEQATDDRWFARLAEYKAYAERDRLEPLDESLAVEVSKWEADHAALHKRPAAVIDFEEYKSKPKPYDSTECDFCDAKMEWGASECPKCKASYTAFRWRRDDAAVGD
jgi:hypothetical protein